MSRITRVTLLGSGVLGGQIALHSAFKGKTVVVYDIADDALERCQAAHDQYAAIYQTDLGATDADIAATKQRLTFTTDLATAVAQADLVIEAVPEIPDVKTAVYKEMAELLPAHTLSRPTARHSCRATSLRPPAVRRSSALCISPT